MEKEYHIHCSRLPRDQIHRLLDGLPSPINRKPLREIYNYRIEDKFMYFVDRGVDSRIAGEAFMRFVDAALQSGSAVTITNAKAQPGG
jgi:hypothetical protein